MVIHSRGDHAQGQALMPALTEGNVDQHAAPASAADTVLAGPPAPQPFAATAIASSSRSMRKTAAGGPGEAGDVSQVEAAAAWATGA